MVVKEVCNAIWSVMKSEFLPTPSKENWETIALDFEINANFPHCIGAVDGKHIRIICPSGSGSMYYNYKQYNSLVFMAIADSNYRFVYVNIGSYGKDCDSAIFLRSEIWKSITMGAHQLPGPKCLPDTDSPNVPYFFVRDEAFALHKHLLRRFGESNLSVEKKIFNYRLSRERRYIECEFGILSNKWRIFHRPINVEPDFAVDIVKACVVLHNFVRERDGILFEDSTTITGLEDLQPEYSSREGLSANNIRQTLCDYFVNVGSVPWQMSKV